MSISESKRIAGMKMWQISTLAILGVITLFIISLFISWIISFNNQPIPEQLSQKISPTKTSSRPISSPISTSDPDLYLQDINSYVPDMPYGYTIDPSLSWEETEMKDGGKLMSVTYVNRDAPYGQFQGVIYRILVFMTTNAASSYFESHSNNLINEAIKDKDHYQDVFPIEVFPEIEEAFTILRVGENMIVQSELVMRAKNVVIGTVGLTTFDSSKSSSQASRDRFAASLWNNTIIFATLVIQELR